MKEETSYAAVRPASTGCMVTMGASLPTCTRSSVEDMQYALMDFSGAMMAIGT